MILNELQPFAIALLIGLATGIERERANGHGAATMGVRTFSLIALTGAAAGVAKDQALTLGLSLALALLVVTGYWRDTRRKPNRDSQEDLSNARSPDIGLTTECAAVLVFGLGFLAKTDPLITGIIGIALVSVLYARKKLHTFSREVLRTSEIRAALILLAFAFVVVPFIPDRAIDPWGVFNPQRLAQIMVMIAGIEFGGYAVERLAGQRIGLLALGFFGGLASSTAVFVHLTRSARLRPDAAGGLIGSGLMATASTVMLFVFIISVAAPTLLPGVGAPAVGAAAAAVVLGFLASRHSLCKQDIQDEAPNPLDLKSVVKLSLFIFGLLAVSAIVKNLLGADALKIFSFASGLFELHGVTYANAALFESGRATISESTVALLLALLASFVSKIAICWTMAFGRFAIKMTWYLFLVIAVGAAIHLVTRGFGM